MKDKEIAYILISALKDKEIAYILTSSLKDEEIAYILISSLKDERWGFLTPTPRSHHPDQDDFLAFEGQAPAAISTNIPKA